MASMAKMAWLVLPLLALSCGGTSGDGDPGLGAPEKVGDVPGDGATVPFHVYVSNQSIDEPEVDIEVWIDDTRVIAGVFAAEGQHNWILFELPAPVGTHQLHAEGMDVQAVIDESFVVPAERWAYLSFWYGQGEDAEPAMFTWNVSDEFLPND